ncbi:peptidase M24 [Bacillus sp. FJAT-27264]|uniref:M24 family metallopeptidase n=1 Tax=Paenibacillus sp. (strain DSM 101736 / FJAT-27264) TaxID=1850362 RepID=UPI000807C909|nr:Xaa-Pro peptidase family protein [Bacillus sp. FJAT-27264]OBZ14965.1 peptidase M24 [Bacillus sp. FJAT-27264]
MSDVVIANRSRAAAYMERHGLSALIATTPENVAYTIGSQLRATNWSMQIYAVMPRNPEQRPCIIIPTNRLGVIAQMGISGADLYVYSDFFVEGSIAGKPSTPDIDLFYDLLQNTPSYATPFAALEAALTQLGIKGQPVGVDEMRMAPDIYSKLTELLPSGGTFPAYGLFRQIRGVKTEAEIALLKKAAALNEQAESELIAMIAAGVHEAEIAQHYRLSAVKGGAVPAMTAVGAGPRSALPLIENYFHTIAPGDLVRFDLCLQLGGYWADTGRTAVLGEPTEWQQNHFQYVKTGWERALDMIRPGVKASEVFEAALTTVQKEGIPHYRRQHVGHAIGLELYDGITLSPGDHSVLEKGMVLCVEVPYYELGAGGFQIEDTVVVTEDGFEFITHMERRLYQQ